MFGGKVPLKCCKASLQRERQVCVHMGGEGGRVWELNSLLCAFETIRNRTLWIGVDTTDQVPFLSAS